MMLFGCLSDLASIRRFRDALKFAGAIPYAALTFLLQMPPPALLRFRSHWLISQMQAGPQAFIVSTRPMRGCRLLRLPGDDELMRFYSDSGVIAEAFLRGFI